MQYLCSTLKSYKIHRGAFEHMLISSYCIITVSGYSAYIDILALRVLTTGRNLYMHCTTTESIPHSIASSVL